MKYPTKPDIHKCRMGRAILESENIWRSLVLHRIIIIFNAAAKLV